MNWVFILVIGVACVCIGLGWHSGFIKSVLHLCSFIVALIAAAIFGPMVSDYIVEEQSEVVDHLAEGVYDTMKLADWDKLQNMAKDDIERLNIPDALKTQLNKNNTASVYEKLGVKLAGQYISKLIAVIIVRCLAYLLVFIAVVVLLIILCNALDLITRLSFLNVANRMAGACVGAAEAVVIIALLFALFTILGNTGLGKSALGMIADNAFLSFIYSHNPINASVLDLSNLF